ncbi:MAG: methyltransferase domain-containing protein [Acidimicrobiia bacterium]
MTPEDPRYRSFPSGFFARADDSDDDVFYVPPRLVTHIDDAAIAAVGDLYDELELAGAVLDLCASWVSHFHNAPARLVALGMNEVELTSNPQATEWLVHDLNREGGATLPFPDGTFDAVTCCVSVDYLVHPIEVFDEVARVLRADGLFVCTFSNRCFPTKAIRGWLATDDAAHVDVVTEYFRRSHGWGEPVSQRRTPSDHRGDPLFAVWAHRRAS